MFIELETFIKSIPLDGQILREDAKKGTGKTEGKGSLASTGVVWDACDGVLALKKLGIAGLAIKKAEEYRDLLVDALEELQEWGEEESDEDRDEKAVGADEEKSVQDAVDYIFGSQRHIPSEDPQKIRPRLESAQKRLRLIATMYTAVVKRRLKTVPRLPHPEILPELNSNEDPGIVNCLDGVLDLMRKIPDSTDELANAFYELDDKEIDN